MKSWLAVFQNIIAPAVLARRAHPAALPMHTCHQNTSPVAIRADATDCVSKYGCARDSSVDRCIEGVPSGSSTRKSCLNAANLADRMSVGIGSWTAWAFAKTLGQTGAVMSALLLTWAGQAMATPAGTQRVTSEPTAAMRCLTLLPEAPGPQPAYPFIQFKEGKPGRVLAEFRFEHADRPPKVEIVTLEGDKTFAGAVREHARHLRVPCLDSREATSVVRFDYRFRPDQKLQVSPEPVDPRASQRNALIACVKHSGGQTEPLYSNQALHEDVQGRVLARLRFESNDRPPVVEIAARRSARLLEREVASWVQDLRMPCYAGEPIEYVVSFVFRIEGSAYGWLPNVDFKKLLAAIPPEQRLRLPASSAQMGCPFAVEFELRQPQMPNHVRQLENWRAERQAFLDWLRSVTLMGAAQQLDWIYGDVLQFEVPCYTIQ